MWKIKLKWWLIKHNFFKYTFHVEGFVYNDKNNVPSNTLASKIKWLGDVEVHCFYRDMNEYALKEYHKKYPQYLGYINLY